MNNQLKLTQGMTEGKEMNSIDDVQKPVGKFAQFTDGVWREVTKGSAGVTLYEHQPASPDVQELVGALQFVLDEFECLVDICWDADHIAIQKARAALAKWEGK